VRTKLLCGSLLAVVVALSLGSASSAARPSAQRFDLSTRAGVTAYLRSLGLRPTGFVIQRGARNYAGPSCPGKRWNCTRGTRVVQIATAAGANVYECTGSPSARDDCTIVQNSPRSQNLATCTQQDSATAQSCSITQTSQTGKNIATVTQSADQSGGASDPQSQAVTQTAVVRQANGSGPSSVTLRQTVSQALSSAATTVAQAQTANQTYTIQQGDAIPFSETCSSSGSLTSDASQSVAQTARAPSATDGTQSQEANLQGHLDQCSGSSSSSTNSQTENQDLSAAGPNVAQTQVGPMGMKPGSRAPGKRGLAYSRCCTFQGTNPRDTISINQSSTQNATQSAGSFAARRPATVQASTLTPTVEETHLGDCLTSGTCTITHYVSQNGFVTTDSATGGHGNALSSDLYCADAVPCQGDPLPTSLAYTGAASQDYHDDAVLSATLTRTDTSPPSPLANKVVTFALVDPANPGVTLQSCSAKTNAAGSASCSVTLTLKPGAYTLVATFSGSLPFLASTTSAPFTVTREESAVAVAAAPASGDYTDMVTVSGTLTEDGNPAAPLGSRTLSFSLGSQGCTATTSSAGVASCTITLTQPVGSYTLAASFAGDDFYLPSSGSRGFSITPEEVGISYTGPTLIAAGSGAVTLSATVTDPAEPGLAPTGVPVTFSLGSQSCSATSSSGTASCLLTAPPAVGAYTAGATVSDPNYEPASSSASAIVFGYLAAGGFVISNAKASTGTSVTFWGSKWTQENPGTGASKNFKGFTGSLTPATTTCTSAPIAYPPGAWSTDPANSPAPPGALPAYMAVITASSIVSGSSTIYSTTIPKVVVVRVLSYSSGAGGTGTGTVVGTVCG
jgi:hypothetical protein